MDCSTVYISWFFFGVGISFSISETIYLSIIETKICNFEELMALNLTICMDSSSYRVTKLNSTFLFGKMESDIRVTDGRRYVMHEEINDTYRFQNVTCVLETYAANNVYKVTITDVRPSVRMTSIGVSSGIRMHTLPTFSPQNERFSDFLW